ncbi:class B sortase [Butyrivibrio sp. WCE2006]|uniref:class B sortase n=1 Tax=Butyrivibrio sp. WCE2006 TaxID=1410611 RepID=UPI0018CC1A4A|nr:class B sortase [Butyrivibrio sp. WCE2006]
MRRRRGNLKKTIRNTILTLSCITFLVMTGIFAIELLKEHRSTSNMRKVQAMAAVSVSNSKTVMEEKSKSSEEQITNLVSLKIEYLYKKNRDLSGWLRINGSEIDYPIMYKEGDNDFYLQHDFFGNEDRNGLLVLDKRCSFDMSDNHLLIHGHNMKSGALFGTLKYYKEDDYLRKHQAIELDTPSEQRFYEIIAVVDTTANGEKNGFNYADYINIGDEESFDKYVANLKARSMHKIAATATYGDQLLTLSTCDYTMKNGRLLVVAKRVG